MARSPYICVAWLLFAVPRPLAAQAPVGPEFRVNSYTTGDQFAPSVAMDTMGRFVVVWDGRPDGSVGGVAGRRFDATGAPLGSEFLVNTYTTGFQGQASVRADDAGNFVVVWTSSGQDGSSFGIVGRRFDVAGVPLGLEFLVNTYTTGSQQRPAVAVEPSGRFVVAWETDDGSNLGVAARRFDAAGMSLGNEFRVNTYTTNSQSLPSVAVDPAGEFVVTWRDFAFGHRNIYGQRFGASGLPLGGEFRVNTTTNASDFGSSSVAKDASGNFIVAWEFLSFAPPPPAPPGDFFYVFTQRFDAAGNRIGSEFRIPSSDQAGDPAVASAAAGESIAVWNSFLTGEEGIFGQAFDGLGAPAGSQFRVSAVTAIFERLPAVAHDHGRRFVVVWAASDPASSSDIFGRRFGTLQSAALDVDASPTGGSDGNRVLEAGESVAVDPSWRNLGSASETFGGAASAFTGPGAPGDPSYTIQDATAGYGPIASGATGSCRDGSPDCYTLSVSVPSSRPATHWDAAFDETLTPVSEYGVINRWTLHVGESFTDVPRANPFYRFIETLLHRGASGGCSATTYCPAGSVTREQMAVFVLVAREGPDMLRRPACRPTSSRTSRRRAPSPLDRGARAPWRGEPDVAAETTAPFASVTPRADGRLRAPHAQTPPSTRPRARRPISSRTSRKRTPSAAGSRSSRTAAS